ncbi:PREDICTED: zinc finger protein weckle-like [Drosophila arizonae]|uniref:Zinc finger protein weckle-like n=1 Tax=Drosophila arizonae TaxID=7263 RepID=A0ABM1NYK1_DROAR|nr:PREDICTED: zinc finger protein weckle-like [Drosophila arizonae]
MGDGHWLNWCRLCAKDDARGNVKIYTSANETTWNSVLVMAVRKYFDVHMQLEDELGSVLCKECYTLISELIDFAEHVTKVQAIFEVLRRSDPNKQLDMEALRQQYGLREGDWTHIIKPVSEFENNTTKHITIEEKPIAAELPKQEFIDLSAGMADETPKNEMIVNNLPIEEILVDHFDDDDVEVEDNPIKPRARRRIVKVSKSEPPAKTAKKKKVKFDEKVDVSNCTEDVVKSLPEDVNDKRPYSPDADLALLPESGTSQKGAEQSLEDLPNSVEDIDDIPSKRRNMKCSWCGKMYHNPASYQKHLSLSCRKIQQRTKRDKNTYCELCNKTLSSAAALKLHREGMHENAKPYVCDHCGKQLKTITALIEHKLVHTEERPFICSICKAGFKNRARLKIHYQIHEEPNYVCNICGKKLQTRRTWNMHKLVHSEERKFKCDVCGALFKRSKTLKKHLLSHTGLRPYICSYCGQTFACNANCRAHKLKKHPQELKKEEGDGISSRLSVPSLQELRIMSQKIPKVEVA